MGKLKRKATKRPRPAPLYLIARGPEPKEIASAHEDESLDWELSVAPLGSSPTQVPARPPHIRKEVREWLRADPTFREANAQGEPLTPFPPTPPPPTAAQREAALKAAATRRARERSYEPGRVGTGTAAGYLEALRKLIGDDRRGEAVGHKGVTKLLRDAFLAESHFRENRGKAGSLMKWIRLAEEARLNLYASSSFQEEMLAIPRGQEILRGMKRRARPHEAEAIAKRITAERSSARKLGAAILASPRGRGPGVKNRKAEMASSRRTK